MLGVSSRSLFRMGSRMIHSAILGMARSKGTAGRRRDIRRIRLVVLMSYGPCGNRYGGAGAAFGGESPQTIAAALQPFVDNHTLAGAVTLVASPDRVLSLEAVGYMDIAAKKPMRTDALFWIASQSKAMTATALMMLVDEGKVNVDDPVEKYLPEFKGQWVKAEQDPDHLLLKRPAHPITVKNVLSHTSGLPFSSPLETPTLDLLPLAARVRSYAMLPLEFEPDSKYAVFQRRDQYRRAHHRGGERHALRTVHGPAPVPTAGDERHHILAQREATPAACEVLQSRTRPRPAWKKPRLPNSATR